MTTHTSGRHIQATVGRPSLTPPVASSSLAPLAGRVMAVTRTGFGGYVLWRFSDHLVGLTAASEDGWVHGGSPTGGLVDSTVQTWTDRLFMLGLLLAGLSLVLGIGLRLAAMSAVMLYLMSWSTFIPVGVHTSTDGALVTDAVVISLLAIVDAGRTWGVGQIWAGSSLGAALPVLR